MRWPWGEVRLRRCGAALGVVIVMFVVSGCMGQIDRADFDKEIAQRGGGLTDEFGDRALAAFARQFPGGKLRSLSIGRSFSAEIPVSAGSFDLDRYVFEWDHQDWRRTGPVQVVGTADLATELYDPLQVPALRRLTYLVDETRTRSRLTDVVIDGISVDNADQRQRTISVQASSPRGRYVAAFAVDGTFLAGERR